MARSQNLISDVQRDESRFGLLVTAIEVIGVDELLKTGLAKRTSIFKWKKRLPVDKKVERGILQAIKQSGGESEGDLLAMADEAIASIKHAKN